MLRLLQWIFVGHVHHWKEDRRDALIRTEYNGSESHVGYVVSCTCKTCGVPKAFTLR